MNDPKRDEFTLRLQADSSGDDVSFSPLLHERIMSRVRSEMVDRVPMNLRSRGYWRFAAPLLATAAAASIAVNFWPKPTVTRDVAPVQLTLESASRAIENRIKPVRRTLASAVSLKPMENDARRAIRHVTEGLPIPRSLLVDLPASSTTRRAG